MNIPLPLSYKNTQFIVEYNEPDSTPDHPDYIVRIVSIVSKGDQFAEMEEQVGKEFLFKASGKFAGDIIQPLDLIIKTYTDHISRDVDPLKRV